MIPRERIATARIPGQASELRLFRHDRDYILSIDRNELMTSRSHGSEDMLAEIALRRPRPDAHVLVGGLGMGFTLARALELLGPGASVEVAELVPEVVEWNRTHFAELNRNALDDRRVDVVVGDVVPLVRGADGRYDAILLDVDNGPEGLNESNDRLYKRSGLETMRRALRPGGVLTLWSSSWFDWFTPRLRGAGFDVAEHNVRARRDKGGRHVIWAAQRPRRS